MKQRALQFIFALLALFACWTPAGADIRNICIDGIYYNIYNSKGKHYAEVTYNDRDVIGNDYKGDVVIPGKIVVNNETYSVTKIGQCAFMYCDSLTSVTLPSIYRIGNAAFSSCSLTELILPASLQYIEDGAFSNMRNLKRLTIPKGLLNMFTDEGIAENRIQRTPFGGNISLEEIIVEEGNQFYTSVDGVLYSKDKKILYLYPPAHRSKEFHLPAEVVRTWGGAFGFSSDTRTVFIDHHIGIGPRSFENFNGVLYLNSDATQAIPELHRRGVLFVPEARLQEAKRKNTNVYSLEKAPYGMVCDNVYYKGADLRVFKNKLYSSAYPSAEVRVYEKDVDPEGKANIILHQTLPIQKEGPIEVRGLPYRFNTEKRDSLIFELVAGQTFKDSVTVLLKELRMHDFKVVSPKLVDATLTSVRVSLDSCDITVNPLGDDPSIQIKEKGFYLLQYPTPPQTTYYNLAKLTNPILNFDGLGMGECVRLESYVVFEDGDTLDLAWFPYNALVPDVQVLATDITQSKMSLSLQCKGLEGVTVEEVGIKFGYPAKYYPIRKEGEKVRFEGLAYSTSYGATPYVKHNGGKIYEAPSKSFKTLGIRLKAWNDSVTASSVSVCPELDLGDAIVKRWKIVKFNDYRETVLAEGKDFPITKRVSTGGLCHSNYKNNSVKLGLIVDNDRFKMTKDFVVLPLEITMLKPKGVSSTCAIVAAKTNVDDNEVNVGFQWRKFDAPESLPSNEGYAAIYGGQIEGYLKNLQSAFYYKVRGFYKDATDECFYSDWVTFDPSDFSYFEPTVHTYPVDEVTDNSIRVKGYVLAGTDEIIEQGFEYWQTAQGAHSAHRQQSALRPATAAENAVNTILAKGQVMYATITGLSATTSYTVRAFVKTQTGTTYGEEVTVTTAVPTGIGSPVVTPDEASPVVTGYYDLSGRRLSSPRKGINIVRYANGTSRKVIIR